MNPITGGPRSNQLLAHMRANQIENLYVLGNHATPRHVDFICRSGLFESLWFDLEHFDISTRDLAVLNMVARAFPITTLARFKATDYQAVMRVLETGVGGIMCSMVNSAAEARQIVEWAKFNNPSPERGEVTGLRGWNGGGIDGAYGTMNAQAYVRHQNNEVAIICQIETEEAVAELDQIVAVPGVDGIFFGPGDYAHRIGKLGQLGAPEVIEAMTLLAASCGRHGKFWGTLGPSPELYQKVRSLGAQLICPGGDVRIMLNGLRELAKVFQAPAATAPHAHHSSDKVAVTLGE
ncbi:HpcH/HpaI aldolase family protein [Oleiharenicola lentus]|uniref:HpcH/HpaI aldolase family protein n=1 Tax=Oleiharenicola lentus TaxID=2508720 RepID=UPI003F66BCA7